MEESIAGAATIREQTRDSLVWHTAGGGGALTVAIMVRL